MCVYAFIYSLKEILMTMQIRTHILSSPFSKNENLFVMNSAELELCNTMNYFSRIFSQDMIIITF